MNDTSAEENLIKLVKAGWKYVAKTLAEQGARGRMVLTILTALIAFAAGAYVVNPVEEGVDHVGSPVAQVIGLVDGKCPDGWKADARRDEHTRISYCDRNGWRVYLHEDGKVSHGCPTFGGVCTGEFIKPDFANNRLDVPGWPND